MARPKDTDLDELASRDPLTAIYVRIATIDARLSLALRFGGAIAGGLLLFIVSVSVLIVSQAVGGPGPEALHDGVVAAAQALDQAVRS